jgi:geranylgeranyl diphosphate synthase type I
MSLSDRMNTMLPIIEAEIQKQVGRLDQPRLRPFYDMLAYHFGWLEDSQSPKTKAKRLRPLLLLLVSECCCNKWLHAVPAAASVELIHNFSLVHDDIQDNSPLRHGMPTVWNKYGIPMAINVGDAIFAIANQSILELTGVNSSDKVIKSAKVLHDTCLELTCGQFMDMSYENRNDMSINDYWPMIEGKTAALLSACTQIGAILGGADESTIDQYRNFGRNLGLAFQVEDDIIGIWGEESVTGKSTSSDLVEGKNSLPILYGIAQGAKFAGLWKGNGIKPEQVPEAAQLLKDEGAYDFARAEAKRLSDLAADSLTKANPGHAAGGALAELVTKLLARDS